MQGESDVMRHFIAYCLRRFEWNLRNKTQGARKPAR